MNCRGQLGELRDAQPQLSREGIVTCVVIPQSCERIFAATPASGRRSPFAVLCDAHRVVSKRYGVWHRIGIDALNTAHPSAFLIDSRGTIQLRFVGRTQFVRAPLEEIVATVKRLDVQ